MDQSFSLTPVQMGMYTSARVAGRPWLYVEQIVVDMPCEDLQPDHMQAAWQDLVQAHPALRLKITENEHGVPVQQLTDAARVAVETVDFRNLQAADAETAFAQFLSTDRDAGIDPSAAPAMRVTLVQHADRHAKLVWTFPHTLLDGRSFALLLAEAFDRYDARCAGKPWADATPEGAADPNAFLTHCRLLAEMSHEDGTQHFSQALAGWEGGTGLCREGVEPVRKVYADRQLTEEETQTIKRLAQQCGVATSTVVLLAWGIVTARLAGRDDTVFGNTVNGRNLVSGSGAAPGCFIATVPLRVRLSRDLTLSTALKRLRASQIALRPHEQTPLTAIRRQLDIPPNRQIFDTLVMFDREPLQDQMQAKSGAWHSRKVELLEEGDAPVTLAVFAKEETRLTVEYDPAQVPLGARLADDLTRFLRNLRGVHPNQLVGSISMIDPQEEDRLRRLSGGAVPSDAGPESCIDIFEARVAEQPDAMALDQPGATPLSYAALNQCAAIRAAALHKKGIGPGDVVGICAARSPAFVIAQLAVWKLGAAFVPMDPGYPIETLNIIAEDSGAGFVLTDASAPQLDVPTIDIAAPLPEGVPADLPDRPGPQPDDLAYIIFTSGSTGRPKGVMIPHTALAAHGRAFAPRLGLSPGERVLQFAALSFDVAIEEIMGTLLSGATLILRTPEMSQSTDVFLQEVDRLGITVLNLPTGFWVALTDALEASGAAFPAGVRALIVGGERVPQSVLRQWRALVPDVRWLNGYGPTETTITSTAHEIRAEDMSAQSVPIGTPLSHARGWVLAADGALIPEGIEGELCFSGPALALGYVGLPEKTAAAFVPSAFDESIPRLYATGDRVFWRDGLIYFIGRVDRQIKLRGFRIEPGQVEAALEARSEIGRAHCALYTPSGGAARLVAWYSAAPGTDLPESGTVRDWIAGVLPPQMMPDLVGITQWPQTPGGKVAEDKLPAPSLTPHDTEDSDMVTSPLVRDAMQVFEKLLQTEGIGPQTSFFDAGGDSLSLLRLLPEVERVFGTSLKPTSLYADPTPSGLVRALQAQDTDPLVVIPIQPEGNRAPLYGVHVLGDNGSFFRPLAAELGQEQPLFGLTVGLLTEDTPTEVADIARFYLQQIERHYPEGPLSLIAVSAGSYVTFELAQQLLAWGRDVRALILLDAEGPGGRPRLGRLGRLGVHLDTLRREGPSYLAQLKAKRVEAKSFAAAQARVEAENDADGPVIAHDIDEFVAANAMAIEAYEPTPYPRRLTIFRAADDRFDSPQARQTGLGWKPVAGGGFDIIDVPGDHLGLLQPPNVSTLAAQVAYVLRPSAVEDGPES